MKPYARVLLLALATLQPAYAGSAADREACEKVKEKIRVIEAKMRNGYTAAQGIRYEARLKQLKDERYERCR